MIESVKPYAMVRDSGLPWLGSIPAHWNVVRGKQLFLPVDVRSSTGEEELLTVSSSRGVIPRSSTKVTMFQAESYVGHKLCWPGDLVINSLWAWGRGLGVSSHHGIVSTAYGVYRTRPSAEVVHAYLHELVRSTPFQWELQVRSKGIWISRLQLRDEAFLTAPLPVPPVAEQIAIVRFLSHHDRRTIKAIRAKRVLIGLLEEQKGAVIHHAITRGLNSTAALKPSCIEWLGDTPEHWEIRRIRSCVSDSLAGIWGEDAVPENQADHVICVRVADFDIEDLRVSTAKLTTRAIPEQARTPRLLRTGDVLMEKSGGGEAEPVGRVVLFDLDQDAVTSNFVTRLRPDEAVLRSKFLLYVLAFLQSSRRNVPSIKQTTGIQNLDEYAYLSMKIAVPPLGEQDEIISHVERETAELRRLADTARQEIALLQEYRTRLNADVVTGKLDVQKAAESLPEDDFDESDALGGIDDPLEGDVEETDALAEESLA